MELEICFEDEYIVAINKPTGLLVHRTTLANDTAIFALQLLRDQLGQRVFPIHRLDRKTSGVLLFAKKQKAVAHFQSTLQDFGTIKRYLAVVRGFFPDKQKVTHPLKTEKGKIQNAETHFSRIAQSELPIPFGKHSTSRYSLIEAIPKTGRMHQIRKHCNHLRHPIIGDRPHGCNKQNKLFIDKWGLNEMLLHAHSLTFVHPFTYKQIQIVAPFFPTFLTYIELLGLDVKEISAS